MKNIAADRKTFILYVIGALVVSVFLSRLYFPVGKTVVIAAIAFYLLPGARGIYRKVRSFGKLSAYGRLTAVTYLLLLLLLISVILGGSIPYFLILVLLGIDYFVCYQQQLKQ